MARRWCFRTSIRPLPRSPFLDRITAARCRTLNALSGVALQYLAGTPATTGTQAIPAVTPGWVPLYVITLANGATAIAAGNIAVHPSAPFLPFTLPETDPRLFAPSCVCLNGQLDSPHSAFTL